jgi:proteasome lid subunit RPN8/RPN11
MTRVLIMSRALRAQIEREARAAHPRECCGLVEGVLNGDAVTATALHPTRNRATDTDRFEIDPAAHISLLRNLRGTERKIVGCYHSHPNGSGELSERDRACDCEDGFVWLIAALWNGACELRAYVRQDADFRAIDLDDGVRSARSG